MLSKLEQGDAETPKMNTKSCKTFPFNHLGSTRPPSVSIASLRNSYRRTRNWARSCRNNRPTSTAMRTIKPTLTLIALLRQRMKNLQRIWIRYRNQLFSTWKLWSTRMIRMRRRIRYWQKKSSNTSTLRANQLSISRRTLRSTSRWPRRSRTAWMTTSLISSVGERSSKLSRSSSKSTTATTNAKRVSPLSRWWTRGLRRDRRAISHKWVRGKAIRSLRWGTYSTRHRAIWFILIPRNLWASAHRVKGPWWRKERWLIHFGLHSLSRKKG